MKNEQNNESSYELDKEIISVTKTTIDRILKEKNPDVLSLYMFYAYTGKWQSTNSVFCTTEYAKKGLNLGRFRMTNAKKTLLELGLIEDVTRKDDDGRISGHYIKVNYVIKNN